jgi:hypothetical protein
LNAPDEALRNQDAERVIDGLGGDGAYFSAYQLGRGLGGDVGLARDGTKYREPLGRDLNPALPQTCCVVGVHQQSLSNI